MAPSIPKQEPAAEWSSSLPSFTKGVNAIQAQVRALTERVKKGELHTEKGISLLELKQQLMLQYLTDLALLLEFKTQGQEIAPEEGDGAKETIWDLAESRVILERMKGVEQKNKYQMDKLVRASISHDEASAANPLAAISASVDPYQFKPRPQALVADEEAEEVDEEVAALEGEIKSSGSGSRSKAQEADSSTIYRAPRIAPVLFDEDAPKGKARREERTEMRRKVKASQSRFMRDLVAEMDDRPEEEDAIGGVRAGYGGDDHEKIHQQEVTTWEESNFVRRTIKKSEQKKAERSALSNFDNEFRNLNDFSAMNMMAEVEERDRSHFSLASRRDRAEDGSKKRKGNPSDDREYSMGDLLGEGSSSTSRGQFSSERRKAKRKAPGKRR